jgi:hypothetical protein
MNLLEHYIIEVHEVIDLEDFPGMIKVDLTYDCWGSIQRTWHTTTKEEWEEDLARGYYLG